MRKHFRESSRNIPARNGPGRAAKSTGRAGPASVVARTGRAGPGGRRAGPGRAEKFRPVLSSTCLISLNIISAEIASYSEARYNIYLLVIGFFQ
jgi:hypothetical protein